MLTLNKIYLTLTLLLFSAEVLIALFINDSFVRPYIGDVLVVVLIYCFVKSFLKVPVIPSAISVLVFSYLIEVLQYFNLVTLLGLEKNKIAKIVLGSSFEWLDLIAYTVGFGLVLIVEKQNTWLLKL